MNGCVISQGQMNNFTNLKFETTQFETTTQTNDSIILLAPYVSEDIPGGLKLLC